MARLSFAIAALALVAAAAGAKTTGKVYRQTCVDSKGQTQAAGAVWYEGVNGCLKLTCTNGVAVGVDSCSCTYPDNTTGKGGDVWYSIPNCKTCTCNSGYLNCTTLLNCVATSTTTAAATVTGTYTSCTGPDSLAMNIGDMYIEGCMNCTCTTTGLLCSGMATCPAVSSTAAAEASAAGQCFMGFLSFISSTVGESYVANGYVFTETCNTCTCTDGTFVCEYTCADDTTAAVATDEYTVTEVVSETIEADLDCDVGEGIVLNGEYYTQDDGSSCLCTDGNLDCPDTTTTVSIEPTTDATVVPTVSAVTDYVCVDTEGNSVNNGDSYQPESCTNCTCVNGVFTCVKTCNRDCTTSGGTVVTHGSKYLTTCQSCKCDDATLTCSNTCSGKVCTVPNSSTTIAQGKTVKIDSCVKCKCTSTVLLQCRDYCETTTSCLCEGRMLKSGKTRTTECTKYTCNAGKLTTKNLC